MFIKLDDIIPNRFQPREIFDEEELNKLADSIKQHGVIEPILVRPVSNKYEIIAGERRYKASVLAGLTKIPALVKQMDDKESSIVAFIENEHRADVSVIEEARTINRILKSNNMKQEELAHELGISQSSLANKLRLLNLPHEIQEALMKNEISERHARSLLTVKDENKQIELLNKIKEKRMTVRELDSEIKNMNNMYGNMNQINNMGNGTNMNMPQPPMGPAPMPAQPVQDDGFMNFLNNYDNNNPLPAQAPQAQPVQDNGFNNFLNNYDQNYGMNNNMPQPPMGPAPMPSQPVQDDGFMNFLNNYDNNNPLPAQAPQAQPVQDNGFNDFLNNYDQNHGMDNNMQQSPMGPAPMPAQPVQDDGFMNFLNNYDNNNPVQDEPSRAPLSPGMPQTPVMPTGPQNNDDGFMNFLNNYDNNNPIQEEVNNSPAASNNDFNGYLNNYENIDNPLNNASISSVAPPIAANYNANDYIENNPNYVDVSKQMVIDNVDDIINRLKNVIDDIKSNSKYKIDTDEINYDDLYQITIKIDKRDF